MEARALCPSKLDKNRQLLLPQTSTLPEQKQLSRKPCHKLMFSIRSQKSSAQLQLKWEEPTHPWGTQNECF